MTNHESDCKAEQETLKRVLVEEYEEKVFYFCLKKTGSSTEAEDLASDILLNCIAQLDKGNTPEQFAAWVWKIARNRYSVWAGRKHRNAESVSGEDIGEMEIADETAGLEETMVRQDELRLLRRELAFISSEYRDIVTAYYMDGRKIREIAQSLHLPEGTVMAKLHRARTKLKEGMDMAREFGTRSYNPEHVNFISSGGQPSGLPWTAIRRMIPMNILCEAHNNPSTVQELAIELGIALPYMEEETELLVRAELLKKLDNGKLLTSFFISPVECQNEINEIVCTFGERHAKALWDLAGVALEKARGLGIPTGEYSEEDAQMYFALFLEQKLEETAVSNGIYESFHRADGGTWGLIGLEEGATRRLPASFFNNNGNYRGGLSWVGYQAMPGERTFWKRRYHADVPDCRLNTTLKELVEGASPADFSDVEQEHLEDLIDKGFCVCRGDRSVVVNAVVFQDGADKKLMDVMKTVPEYLSLWEEMRQLVSEAREVVSHNAIRYLQEDFLYYVAMSLTGLRSVFARLWKDTGCYSGESAQFCAFFC